MNIIQVKNVSFRYEEEFIFYRFNLQIKTGEWVTLTGPNGSGKTTLVKLLTGLFFNDSEIMIAGMRLKHNNLAEVRSMMGVILENVDNQFITETVRSEIAFVLENLQYNYQEINYRVNQIASKLKIEHLLDKDPHYLSGGEKQLVALASVLVLKPKILLFDDAFVMLDQVEKQHIFAILTELQQEEGLTIINITHNLEEAYYGERLLVLNEGKILLDGSLQEVFKQDRVLKRIGLEIPFLVDLSIKLKMYGLVTELILDADKLVDTIWK